jgi:hypothetical protein
MICRAARQIARICSTSLQRTASHSTLDCSTTNQSARIYSAPSYSTINQSTLTIVVLLTAYCSVLKLAPSY